MNQNRKSTVPLILTGLAAFAMYKYSKLSADQKKNIGTTIREKGEKMYDKYIPQKVKDLFSGETKYEQV